MDELFQFVIDSFEYKDPRQSRAYVAIASRFRQEAELAFQKFVNSSPHFFQQVTFQINDKKETVCVYATPADTHTNFQALHKIALMKPLIDALCKESGLPPIWEKGLT